MLSSIINLKEDVAFFFANKSGPITVFEWVEHGGVVES
jgi:hypothetical protein